VPKKTQIMLVKNKNIELIPTRISSGWRMSVDYKKLNLYTRKDQPYYLIVLPIFA